MADRGVVIARRSVSLTKSYPVLGVFLTLVGALISALGGVVGADQVTTPAASATGLAGISEGLPYLAVPLQALAAILFSTPVLLLFVYDKNNGVLEYLLSLGMTQRDVYRQYLKAAIILGGGILAFDVAVDVVAGAVQGTGWLMPVIAALVVAIGLPVVAFGALLMMSFSSLQKQRVGSNQPLGMAIGVFLVLPSYLVPFILPSAAFALDLVLAAAIVSLSLLTYLLAGRLISREKLLP